MVDEASSAVRESRTPDGVPYPPLAHSRPGGGVGGALNNTGALSRSFHWRIAGSRVYVFTNKIGARLHNNGGVVRARNVEFLTIPLTAVAARVIGGARNFPAPLHSQFRRNANRGVLADRKGTAHYALVKEVTIPARRFMGLGKRGDARVIDRMNRWFTSKLPGAA
jgi:phage gpG-like protein